MDLYALFKFLHVASVIVWLGGGFALVALAIFAEQANDKEQLGRTVQTVAFLSPRLFVPASLAAAVFGLISAYLDWGFGYLWLWIGLAGFAATFATGILVLAPRSEALAKVIATEGYGDRVAASARELLSVAKFDFVMLFVVVADMIYKPGFRDWPLLIVLVLVLAGGAYVFLRPVLMARGGMARAT